MCTVQNSKTFVKWPLKKDKTKMLMTNGSLIKVESIAECSKADALLQAFCNTFDLHKAIFGVENHLSVILKDTVLHRFYCIHIVLPELTIKCLKRKCF